MFVSSHSAQTDILASAHSAPSRVRQLDAHLFGRSETAREIWLQQPDMVKIVDYFLVSVSKPYDLDEGIKIATYAFLFAAATVDIGPDVEIEDLHRDDLWQQTHANGPQREYVLGSDVGIGLYVPGVNKPATNGATLVRVWSNGC